MGIPDDAYLTCVLNINPGDRSSIPVWWKTVGRYNSQGNVPSITVINESIAQEINDVGYKW